jgi:hypothetical protein
MVIIDNMMNLEVLFSAADLTGNDTLRQIAISHADKTMMNQLRADGGPPLLELLVALWPPLMTTLAQDRRFMSLNITPRPAPSSQSTRCRVTPTQALGVAVKHGAFMASLTVCDGIYSHLFTFPS